MTVSSKIADATFAGKSGAKYTFEVYPLDTEFNSVGAVYVFSRRTIGSDGRGTHSLLYIGQTESLGERIPNHEKWPCVLGEGANCICVRIDQRETSRLVTETDLRGANWTPCNDQ